MVLLGANVIAAETVRLIMPMTARKGRALLGLL
jgi:hypothetical protein